MGRVFNNMVENLQRSNESLVAKENLEIAVNKYQGFVARVAGGDLTTRLEMNAQLGNQDGITDDLYQLGMNLIAAAEEPMPLRVFYLVVTLVATVALTLLLIPVMDPRLGLLSPPAVVAFILGGLAGTGIGRIWAYESINLLGPSRSNTIRSSSPVITTILVPVPTNGGTMVRTPLDRTAGL